MVGVILMPWVLVGAAAVAPVVFTNTKLCQLVVLVVVLVDRRMVDSMVEVEVEVFLQLAVLELFV